MTKLILKVASFKDIENVCETNIDALLMDYTRLHKQNACLVDAQAKPKIIFAVNLADLCNFIRDCPNGVAVSIAVPISPEIDALGETNKTIFHSIKDKIAVVQLKGREHPRLFKKLREIGFTGLMIELDNSKSVSCLNPQNLSLMARLKTECFENQLEFGVLGQFEDADIPRLVAFNLDYVGLNGDHRQNEQGRDQLEFFDQYRTQLKREQFSNGLPPRNDQVLDKLIIRDFVLPVSIGAYAKEHRTKQNVCFNIIAEVENLTREPETINDVISYDIILDAIRMVVATEHIDLVETIAERIASRLLIHSRILRVTIRVEKLELGPIGVGVEIIRQCKS